MFWFLWESYQNLFIQHVLSTFLYNVIKSFFAKFSMGLLLFHFSHAQNIQFLNCLSCKINPAYGPYLVLIPYHPLHHLHRLIANLSCFQKSTYYTGIKIFNILPSSLKSLVKEKSQFKVALKLYLNTHSFYYVDEFLRHKMTHPF
jgi:hypothetical protein